MGISPARFRTLFPALETTVHLASCSVGAASLRLIAALGDITARMRAEGAPWDRWLEEVEAARRGFAALVRATPEEIAVVASATEGAFQVGSTMDWATRPYLVTSELEFASVAQVWQAQAARGARVRWVPDSDGVVEPADYAAAVGEDTALVSIPLVSYRNGRRMPVAAATAAARAAGARVFVDAFQAVGVLDVDVRALDCDYLVCGANKYLLGLPGIAFLYVRDGLTDPVPPVLTGEFGRVTPGAFDPRALDFPAQARRFESGSPAVPSAYAATAGLATLAETVPAEVEAHVARLTAAAHHGLVEAGERVWSPAEDALRGPLVALADPDPPALAAFLRSRGVVASPRGHVLRLAFHYYNDETDVAAALAALREYRAGGAR